MEGPDHQSSHSTAALLGSNDGLLTEILLWLPVISILRFKCVSKHLRSLLSHPTFTRRYDTTHFRKSPPGCFLLNRYVPFDDEDQTDPPFRNLDFFFDPNRIRILQSCNGLLLCCSLIGWRYEYKYYVFNPTTRQFVMIPPVPGGKTVHKTICFMGLAFHQTDCVHYKVVCILKLDEKPVGEEEEEEDEEEEEEEGKFQIQTYLSDTSEWKISVESFSARTPTFASGVYWNGAIYWALSDLSYMYFKFDDEQLHLLPLPVEAMSSPTRTRYLGESRGHLYLIVYSEYGDKHLPLKVYEMMMDRSGWFVKYHVELDELKKLPNASLEVYSPTLTIIDVIRGEKDEDTFMVLGINGLYITYNVHDRSSKMISKLNMGGLSCANIFPRYSQTLASF